MSSLNSGGQQAYHLEIRRAGVHAKDLSVVSFDGVEEMGEPSRFVIRLTHPAPDLPRASFLGMPATFTINPPALPGLPALGDGRKTQGIVTGFSTLASSKDATIYEMVLESRLAQLRNVKRCRLFLDQSFPKIIESILREHGFAGDNSHFSFTLLRTYEKRPIVTQWHESDLAFIQRLCRRSGIWFRIDAGEWGEVAHFGDDFTHYRRQPALTAPFSENAGLESVGAEAVHAFETHCKNIQQSFIVRDYNRQAAPAPIETEVNLARNDKTTFGQSYAFGTLHLDPAQAKWEGQLRHEAALSEQIVYQGKSNVLGLVPGAVFRLNNKVLPDAEFGQLITRVTHHGARDAAYHNTYAAIPSDRIYRLPLHEADWPKISGTVSARIASPNRYPYAYMNEAGDYMVQFDFDRDPRQKGLNSCWMRLAKPFAGSVQTGFHFPLLDGTEVAVAFHDGDPDKPYIAHALHDSQNGDLITNQNRWMSRNEIRTQSNNKLRLEDWEGFEHVKLATEYGKSQLNLGHLVDAKKQKRGEGLEIRTDLWGSVRAGKGLFLSADAQAKANGQQLDMKAALNQLQLAVAGASGLADAARVAKAEIADLKAENQWLKDSVTELKQAVMVLSAPAGVAVATPERVSIAAGKDVHVSTAANANVSALRNVVIAASDVLSLFAHKLGIKLFAARGKVLIQAQSDAMELVAERDMHLTSANGTLIANGANGTVISGGGSAYVKVTGDNVEIGGAGNLILKIIDIQKSGPGEMKLPLPKFEQLDVHNNEKFILSDQLTGRPTPNRPYRIQLANGQIVEGKTTAKGETSIAKDDIAQGMKLLLQKNKES
ncbi:VgrG protein [Collimonas arenae]|uniref:VgrG protein n=2 Tax=Collimonas arenae TaxID=279058 RepID=A0A0A1FHH3_9BURK|nr:VgrG protein [Collimonas arenae]